MADNNLPSYDIHYFMKLGFTRNEARVFVENWKIKSPQTPEEIRRGLKTEEKNRFDSAMEGLNLKPESKE